MQTEQMLGNEHELALEIESSNVQNIAQKMKKVISQNKPKKSNINVNKLSFNPLLENDEFEDFTDEDDDDQNEEEKYPNSSHKTHNKSDDYNHLNESVHPFELLTNSARMSEENERKKCKFLNNVKIMICLCIVLWTGGLFFLIRDPYCYAFAMVTTFLGLLFTLYTFSTFFGFKLCPKCYMHSNAMIFNDIESKIYIEWNGVKKMSVLKYSEFCRLYIEKGKNDNSCIVYIATNERHFRFNKYLTNVDVANEYIQKTNHWWNVLRFEKRKYDYRKTLQNMRKKQRNNDDNQSSKMEVDSEYVRNEGELKKIIKKLKYQSFKEKDIEIGCKLSDFFESKYHVKMVEEYDRIQNEFDGDKNGLIACDKNQYIAGALLLKFETMDCIIQKRKESMDMEDNKQEN